MEKNEKNGLGERTDLRQALKYGLFAYMASGIFDLTPLGILRSNFRQHT